MSSSAPKPSTDALALFGGRPAFDHKLHVGQPNLGDRAHFMARVERILDSRWFTNNGEQVQELERELAKYLGVRNVIAVCNATIGLEIAIRALPLTGEVIVPALTFIATAHALQWQQITPVFCDIDPATHVLDPAAVERLITDRTSGILGVHVWGRPCVVDELQAIADRNGLQLMFDAAHAFGCSHRGRMIGGFGARRGVQLPRHQVLQFVRGWRDRDRRRRTGAQDPPDDATSASPATTTSSTSARTAR